MGFHLVLSLGLGWIWGFKLVGRSEPRIFQIRRKISSEFSLDFRKKALPEQRRQMGSGNEQSRPVIPM